MKAGAILTSLVLLMSACARPRAEVTPDAYAHAKDTRAVVLMAVNWGRRWGCGSYSAQLKSFAFDRVPVQKQGDETPADLVVDDAPPALLAKPLFVPYAFLVEPGEYALSTVRFRVGYDDFGASRSSLLRAGKPVAGSFEIRAGEIVYVGHFFLNCVADRPPTTIWRYYAEGRESFRAYLAEVKEKYPFLDVDRAQFRLFRTTVIGHEYQLQ